MQKLIDNFTVTRGHPSSDIWKRKNKKIDNENNVPENSKNRNDVPNGGTDENNVPENSKNRNDVPQGGTTKNNVPHSNSNNKSNSNTSNDDDTSGKTSDKNDKYNLCPKTDEDYQDLVDEMLSTNPFERSDLCTSVRWAIFQIESK